MRVIVTKNLNCHLTQMLCRLCIELHTLTCAALLPSPDGSSDDSKLIGGVDIHLISSNE